MDSSFYILLISVVVLFVLNVLLFISSVFLRIRFKKWQQKLQEYKKELMPLILEYLEDGHAGAVTSQLSGISLQYHAFETLISEMLEYVEGSDANKLRSLLITKPVYEHHVSLLMSNNEAARVKACVYFGTASLIDRKVINLLKDNLRSSNLLLAFSAASALMSVSDVEIRAEALGIIALMDGISEMALVELMHKYHEDDQDQLEQEGELLIPILEDKRVDADTRALFIMAIAEIGYYNLTGYLLEKLQNPEGVWSHKEVLYALIKAQGDFSNIRAIDTLRIYLRSDEPLLVGGAIEELADYGSEKDLEVMRSLLVHESSLIRETAVSALLDNKVSDSEIMLAVPVTHFDETSKMILKYKTNRSKFSGTS